MSNNSVHPSQWPLDHLVDLVSLKIEGLLRDVTTGADMIPGLQGIKEEIQRWRAKDSEAMSDADIRLLCLRALGH